MKSIKNARDKRINEHVTCGHLSLLREFPGCGNIVTFAQFLFIAIEGFIFETHFGRKKPAIPVR